MYLSRMGWVVEEDVEIVGDKNFYPVLQNVVIGVEPGEYVFVSDIYITRPQWIAR